MPEKKEEPSTATKFFTVAGYTVVWFVLTFVYIVGSMAMSAVFGTILHDNRIGYLILAWCLMAGYPGKRYVQLAIGRFLFFTPEEREKQDKKTPPPGPPSVVG